MNSRLFFHSRHLFRAMPVLAVLSLTGCLQDSASYILPEKDHAITLVRNQPWFWLDSANIEVIAIRLPECNDGITLDNVPRNAQLNLYQAPNEYDEPFFILKTDTRLLVISTQSCQVQALQNPPANLGESLGYFQEKDGKFQFVANQPAAAADVNANVSAK